mgnify:CR=1 FL=1
MHGPYRICSLLLALAAALLQLLAAPCSAQSAPESAVVRITAKEGERSKTGTGFIVQLSADLSRLLYAQRFGGSGDDVGRASWVGPQNQFVLVGHTDSPNFATVNALFPNRGGRDDAFLIRLIP